jgi:hypothetical protein
MTSFLWRGWSPDRPCNEYAKFQQVAEELVANIDETASPEQFEQAQKSLLFLFHEYTEHMDPLHPRFPGGHRCLQHCYLLYSMRIKNKAIRQKPLQSPSPPPAPQQQSITAEEVVNNLRTLANELNRPRDTFLGTDAPPPPQENTR